MKTMILIPALAPGAELIDYLQALSDAQLGQLVVVDDGSGRKVLGMSLEVNHRFIDGYHISQFANFFDVFSESL